MKNAEADLLFLDIELADGKDGFGIAEEFGFFHIQWSYIVNLKYIEKVNSHEVTLCNGLKVVIGRGHSKEFKKEFFKWRMWLDN